MKIITFFITLLIAVSSFTMVSAEENLYYVVDSQNDTVLEEFDSYRQALRYYNAHKDEYVNLSLLENEKVIETEYAVVTFNTNEGCTLEHEYKDNATINGCYGIDAAYLYSEYDEIYYMIAGAIGHSDISELTIIPVDDQPENLSVYENMDGVLYHNIKTSLSSSYYSYSIELDESPEELEENIKYYSYDSRYFYDSYFRMIDDYVSGNYANAVNKETYYNYYLYLPFRSLSNYSYEEIKNYFDDVLLINGKMDSYSDKNNDGANDYLNRSQLYEELGAFFTSEDIYGINALTLLSMSIYETSYGKSLSTYLTNNLFRNAAFTTLSERDNQRYSSLENSVYAFARYYMAQKYANPLRNTYHGDYLGNKNSGLNVEYSSDPYYSEKVASVYYKMDRDLGFKDRNSESIVLKEGKHKVYADEELSERISTVNNESISSYVILEEKEDSYKVQLDKCLASDYLYDWKDNVGYITKENTTVINSEKIHEREYSYHSFDFNEGNILKIENAEIASAKETKEPVPYKEGYEFKSYENGIAQYRKIKSISLSKGLDEPLDLNGYPNLKDAEIRINYEDGSHSYKDLTSEMLVNWSSEEFTISYNGVSVVIPVQTKDYSSLKEEMEETKNLLLNDYEENKNIDEEALNSLKENTQYVSLNMNEIRTLDKMCKEVSGGYPAFYIEENDYDLSFSGLYLAFDLNKEKNSLQFYDDTYYVLNENISIQGERVLSRYAEAYGFTVEGSIHFSFRYNLQAVEPTSLIVCGVYIEDKDNNSIYSVYHLDEEGNVVKCYTTQTDSYIQFVMEESGDYIFLSKESANTFNIADQRENISSFNNGIDSFSIAFEVMIFMAMSLYCMISFVIYFILESINKKIRQNYYRMMKYYCR